MNDAEEKYLLELYRAYPQLERRILYTGIRLAGRAARRFPNLSQYLYDLTLFGCQLIHALRRALFRVAGKI